MSSLPDYTAERRARLAAERILDLRERRFEREMARLESFSAVLSGEIDAKHRELDALRREAETLRRDNAALRDGAANSAAAGRNLWAALQAVQDGFAIWDADHRLAEANDAYLAVFDGLEEVRPGVPHARLCELLLSEGIVDPGAEGAAWADRMRARWSETPIPDITVRLWNGQVIRVIDRALPDGGVVSICVDETGMTRLLSAVDAIPHGFVLFDRGDRLVTMNQAYRDIYLHDAPGVGPGTSFAEILRHGLATGSYPEAAGREEEWFEDRMEVHLRGDGVPHEVRMADGRWLRVIEHKTPDGGTAGLRIDITDLKDQQMALEAARESAEAAARAKSAFLSNMSHEIRTPVNGITGLAQILLDGDLDPEQRDFAETLRGSADALLALVDDVLDYSAIESGRLDLRARPFDPRALLADPVGTFAAEARRRGLDLRLEAAADLPATLVGDDRRLRQVVTHLLANAVKFTETGSVTLRASAEPLEEGRARLTVAVADTGIGVPAACAGRIFEGFARAEEEHDRRQDGTGLGLALCRRLVELMGGEIGYRPGSRGGSVFSFSVALPAGAEAPAPATDCPATPAAGRLSVLAAEDNATNRLILEKLLAPLDVDLRLVATGRQALDALAETAPDLVLMDISMPDMDGKEATGRIRAWEAAGGRAPLPILAMTAHARDEDVAAIRAAGLDDVLTKPLSRAVLAERFDRIRAAGQAAAAAALRRKAGAPAPESAGA